MTESQGELPARYCPVCGGLMVLPAGSSFYWHADNNHPRCAITNISEPPLVVQESDQQGQSSRKKQPKK
jgi:hypothetical protein